MEYQQIPLQDINRELFRHFVRHQTVTCCWRKEEGRWVIKPHAFIDDWNEADYAFLVRCLQNTLRTGGVLFGAFDSGRLKGFSSVEGKPIGSEGQYLDLSCLHVSEELRGLGIGKQLFARCVRWAKEQGAQKLYISSHSAVETQAFYRAVGCVEATEYHAAHVEQEPFDCQLEYCL